MTENLHAQPRPHAGRNESNRLRRQGLVPGVLYGLHNPNMLVEFAELQLFDVLHHKGDHGIIEVDVNGHTEKAMIKEVQRSPLTRKVTHIDLQRIDETNRIKTSVPVKIIGERRYLNTNDVIQVQMNEVEIEGKPSNLPSHITVDISKIPPGGKFTLRDIELSEDITVLGNPETIIAVVTKVKNNVEEKDPNEASLIHEDTTIPQTQ